MSVARGGSLRAIGSPVAEKQRAEVLDVLRGFALLGIFLAHVPGFSGWDVLTPTEHATVSTGIDPYLQFLRDWWIRGKFFSLFSLLFGFGFAIQCASAERSGDDVRVRFRRRQLGLLALGLVHSFFWHGDILLKYALLGLLLLPTVGWSNKAVFRLALICLAARGLWAFVPWLAAGAMQAIGDGATGGGSVDGAVRGTLFGYSSDRWPVVLSANASFLRLKWLYVLYEGKLLSILGLFALGTALGRWRVHERTAELRGALRKVLCIGGAVGVVGNAVLAVLWDTVPLFPPSALRVAEQVLAAIAVPALALAMAAAIALAEGGGARRWLAWLAAPGRMALTTYLSQTVVGIGVFYGVGLGLRGGFSLAACGAFAVAVFVVQAFAARVWLGFFRYGPVEWAWRCGTYGRWLPLRRRKGSLGHTARTRTAGLERARNQRASRRRVGARVENPSSP